MITEKYYEEWYGKKYPVRLVPMDERLGVGSPIAVADYDLWTAIEYAYEHEDSDKHSEAVALDNEIYYYCDSGFIASDPSDDEIRKHLRKNGAILKL